MADDEDEKQEEEEEAEERAEEAEEQAEEAEERARRGRPNLSTSSSAILWIGFFLIAMLVITNWKDIQETLF